jgi:hypothetical protein
MIRLLRLSLRAWQYRMHGAMFQDALAQRGMARPVNSVAVHARHQMVPDMVPNVTKTMQLAVAPQTVHAGHQMVPDQTQRASRMLGFHFTMLQR